MNAGSTSSIREFYRITPTGISMLPIPEKADTVGLLKNRMVVRVEEDVPLPGGGTIRGGSIVSYDMAHPEAPPIAVFQPGPRQSVGEAAVTKGHVVATVYDNVVGGPTALRWTATNGRPAGWLFPTTFRCALPRRPSPAITCILV